MNVSVYEIFMFQKRNICWIPIVCGLLFKYGKYMYGGVTWENSFFDEIHDINNNLAYRRCKTSIFHFVYNIHMSLHQT